MRQDADLRQAEERFTVEYRTSRPTPRLAALDGIRRTRHKRIPLPPPNGPVPDLNDPDTLFPLLLVGIAVAVALVLWRLRARAQRRIARRKAAGYQLMDCLKAYTAWIDWHRDEPLLHNQDPESLAIPAALQQAVQIKDEHFPELSRLMLQLLQSHRELMQYLWEENILRMSGASSGRPHYADPRYHQLRDTQDAALDSLFLRCRQLIGDAGAEWRRTRSDFSFSSSMGASTPSTPSY